MMRLMLRRRKRNTKASPQVGAVARAWYALLQEEQRAGTDWSLEDLRQVIDGELLPALGDRSVGSITRSEIEKLYDELEDRGGNSDRFLWVVSEIFRHAESEGLRPRGTNPCIYVKPMAGG